MFDFIKGDEKYLRIKWKIKRSLPTKSFRVIKHLLLRVLLFAVVCYLVSIAFSVILLFIFFGLRGLIETGVITALWVNGK